MPLHRTIASLVLFLLFFTGKSPAETLAATQITANLPIQTGESGYYLLFPAPGEKQETTLRHITPVAESHEIPEGVKLAVVTPATPSKATASQFPNLEWLPDSKNTLRQQLQLEKRYKIKPTESALVSIDRAGWIRRVDKITNPALLSQVIQRIGDPTPQLAVGSQAPDFALQDMNGKQRWLRELRGKKNLLLTFFPRCFTGTCKMQLSSIVDVREDLQRNDVEVWAVSVDPAEGEHGQREYAKYLNAWFPFLPDTGRNLCLLYGAVQAPNQMAARMSVFIDKTGKVRWIDKQINPKTHGADVVATLRELGLGVS